MRGVYTAHVGITSLSIAKTVLLGEVGAGCAIEILELHIYNLTITTEEQLQIALQRITTLGSPVGATTVDIAKHSSLDASTSVTWLGDLTTEPTTYTTAPLDRAGPPNLSGYNSVPLPEGRFEVAPSTNFGLRLLVAPTNAFKAACLITYREIG